VNTFARARSRHSPEAGGPPEILIEDGGLGVSANGDNLRATVYFEIEAGVLAEDLVCSNLLAVIVDGQQFPGMFDHGDPGEVDQEISGGK
jgi:hypothetical protein